MRARGEEGERECGNSGAQTCSGCCCVRMFECCCLYSLSAALRLALCERAAPSTKDRERENGWRRNGSNEPDAAVQSRAGQTRAGGTRGSKQPRCPLLPSPIHSRRLTALTPHCSHRSRCGQLIREARASPEPGPRACLSSADWLCESELDPWRTTEGALAG